MDKVSNYVKENIAIHCQELEKTNKILHAFIEEKDRLKRLQAEIKKLDSKKPLYMLAVGIKDVFRVDGLPTHAGSRLPAEEFQGKQANIVTRLKRNGALIIGKTVTSEFAYAQPGPTVNPLSIKCTPGGSSSGSAAAVSSGLCKIALGTQTIGSTIRPASYCAVVGFKCSFGRIDTSGLIHFAPSLDTVGLLAKKTIDLLPVAKIVFNKWNNLSSQSSTLRFGIPQGKYLNQAQDNILNVFKKTVKKLETKGHTVKNIAIFADIEDINRDIWTIAAFEFARVHKKWYEEYKFLYQSKTSQLILLGKNIKADAYNKAKKNQQILQKSIGEMMDEHNIDFWLAPSATSYPPFGLKSTGDPAMSIPWTFSKLPAVSIPIKTKNPPLGIQIIGRYNSDELLLIQCQKIESVVSND